MLKSINTLNHELHVHLYGCLTAKDLWEIGKDSWKEKQESLAWFAAEFAKATGQTICPEDYWQHQDGEELLAKDFVMAGSAPFPVFQAKFNLAIALCPAATMIRDVCEKVFIGQKASGIKYGEYRTFLPHYLNEDQLFEFMSTVAEVALNHSDRQFEAKILYSLPRFNEECERLYQVIKHWQTKVDSQLAETVVGIDFCGSELGFAPELIEPVIKSVLKDNASQPSSALAVCYHVGEMFEDKTLISAIRWVHQAVDMGVHRIGHAIALGMSPESEPRTSVKESIAEARRHLNWLQSQKPFFAEIGYRHDPLESSSLEESIRRAELERKDYIVISQNRESASRARLLQDALMDWLRNEKVVIESCPTSNFRIGGIPSPADHPLPRFMDENLNIVIGSDDPGIFAGSLHDEEALLKDLFMLDSTQITRLNDRAVCSKSTFLSGRHG